MTTSENALRQAYWKLPHNVRRSLFKLRNPSKYESMMRLRSEEPQSRSAPTFKPFLDCNCIFIHIPKAAGISVGHGLFGRNTGNHTTLTEYYMAFEKDELDRFFKFAFVRNPWDRLLSAYLFLKNGGRNPSDDRWQREHLSAYDSFGDFVVQWVNRSNVEKGIHFRPQYKFLTLPGKPEPCIDFLGYFENIEQDYEHIRRRIGRGEKLASENKTAGKKDYRSYYTDETADIVANVYREDIEMFGYDFDNKRLADRLQAQRPRP